MTIEIHQPDLEALIHQRMATGEFQSVTDLIRRAMLSLPLQPPATPPAPATDPQRRAAAFRRWAESHTGDTVLPDDAMSRAGFYGERG